MPSERLEQLRALDPDDHLLYVCFGCGCCYPELIAEGVYDLECPNCEHHLQVED